jgi:hypothetical protein
MTLVEQVIRDTGGRIVASFTIKASRLRDEPVKLGRPRSRPVDLDDAKHVLRALAAKRAAARAAR